MVGGVGGKVGPRWEEAAGGGCSKGQGSKLGNLDMYLLCFNHGAQHWSLSQVKNCKRKGTGGARSNNGVYNFLLCSYTS